MKSTSLAIVYSKALLSTNRGFLEDSEARPKITFLGFSFNPFPVSGSSSQPLPRYDITSQHGMTATHFACVVLYH